MIWLLLVVPVGAYVAVLFLYRHTGKKELLRFDLVQFAYAFVVLPIFFIWLKSFVYFLFRSELGVKLSTGQLFTLDTVFSTLFLYIYAFVVIHSVTKTFNLKHYRDPLYDLFAHSEYYHVWLSHVVILVGAMAGVSLLSLVNLLVPFSVVASKVVMVAVVGAGLVTGALVFVGVWLTDPDQAQYMRLMKLSFGVFFMVHALMYFVFDPKFRAEYFMFWFLLMVFAGATVFSVMFERSKKALSWTEKLKHLLWEKKLYVLKADGKRW